MRRACRPALARPRQSMALVLRIGTRQARSLRVLVQAEQHAQLGGGLVGAGAVGLVDDEDIGDLQDARLDRLDVVAHAGHRHDDHRLRRAHDLDLGLPRADRLDDDDVEASGVERAHGVAGGGGQPAEAATAGHAADEDVGVAGQLLHADAVAEDRAAGEGAAGVDGDDADALVAPPQFARQLHHERALARAGRAGESDDVRVAAVGVQLREDALRLRARGSRSGDDTRQRAPVAVEQPRRRCPRSAVSPC